MKSQASISVSPPEIYNLPLKKKEQLQVSALSRYGDLRWHFIKEIQRKNMGDSKKTIGWDKITFHDGTQLINKEHAELFESARDFVYSLLPHTGVRTGRIKHSSIISIMPYLKILLIWMVDKKYSKFSQLNKNACTNYVTYLNTLEISKSSLCQALYVLAKLYWQRFQINDAILEHPFNYESTNSISGYNQAEMEKNKTLRIPEVVIISLIQKALQYIESKASYLIETQKQYERLNAKIINRSKLFRDKRRRDFARTQGFANFREFKKELRRLLTACYIIIAFFSGMRDSETISIKKGCVKRKLTKSRLRIYKISAVLYKTSDEPYMAHWLVPSVVETAVKVLSLLTLSLRNKSGLRELFLTNHGGKISVLTNSDINVYLKNFVKETGVSLYEGKDWYLHTHQFRKSFAYYMMKENKCNLKFLQKQFKHLSMDMTLWYAETDDEELKQDVYEMSIEVTREILRPILLDDGLLAGKGGESITQNRDAYFSGRTVREKESLFNEIIFSDLYVRGTYIGLCIWNPEQARCEAGFECRCNPNVCKNAVVTQEHLPIWVRLKERHERLLSQPDIEPMKKQFLQTQLNTFVMPILKKLGHHD